MIGMSPVSGADPAAPGTVTGTWRVVVPAPCRWLNSNHRGDRRADAPLVNAWRQAAGWRVRAAKVPPLARAHVFAYLNLNPWPGHFDPGNWYPTAKACVDGLVDAGVLPDDDHERLLGPDMRRGTPAAVRGGELVLVITELEKTT